MELLVNIEYRTRWGESLVMRMGERRIALQYEDGGIWRGTVAVEDSSEPLRYGYELWRDGACVRREWRPHEWSLPAVPGARGFLLHDRWLAMPADAPFFSSAFAGGIFGRRAALRPGAAEVPAAGPDDGGKPEAGAAVGGVTLRVVQPAVRPDEVLAVAGSGPELGRWERVWPMDDSRFPEWGLSLPAVSGESYKFLIADRRTLAPLRWEEGENRTFGADAAPGIHRIEAAAEPRFAECRWRGAGTAVPVFSLRSAEGFGIGEFRDLELLVDWAVATGQHVVQLLPVNDTTMSGTWEDSYPYNACSSFALHPQFVRLTQAGVEEDEEFRRLRSELNALPAVDYERVNREKLRLLRRAFDRHGIRTTESRGFREFVRANAGWLLPYAAFRVLRDEFGTADFAHWGEYARYDRAKIEAYGRRRSRRIAFYCFVQYHLHVQLSAVAAYARSRGVVLKGDLPIGVSRTSVDAWLHPELFRLDAQAGAPPDAFSETGQNWHFPTYDWERMAQDGYAWWRSRLGKMSEYFDAYRIDHILGFFRIWEIPGHAVRALSGHFAPAMPYSAEELRKAGFDLGGGRYTVPEADDEALRGLFGELADEVRTVCLENGRPRPGFDTQRAVGARFPGDDPRSVRLREGMMRLLEEVLFVEDPRSEGRFHPRIAAQHTYVYKKLDGGLRERFDRLCEDFFYRRHDGFWRESALRKLPALLGATRMLACGEDLGMIPSCVPDVMHDLRILSLELQRMPKLPGREFGDTARYPYLSVCTTSTHDMNPLRAWWEEDRGRTQRFYREVLGGEGEAPADCTPAICRRIVAMHLAAPSMFAVLPLQDWLATDDAPRRQPPGEERINIPADPHHYWRYRMPLLLEELLAKRDFSASLREMIASSGRG